jgi:PhnB protein
MTKIMELVVYLSFNGNAGEAIDLYQHALGAKVQNLMRFSDATSDEPISEDLQHKIMHAVLAIGNSTLMISDTIHEDLSHGDGGVSLSINCDDVASMESMFAKLADKGIVNMPLEDTFWGARFGILQDTFGITWMFNYDYPQQ